MDAEFLGTVWQGLSRSGLVCHKKLIEDIYMRWLLGADQEKPIFSTRLLATLL